MSLASGAIDRANGSLARRFADTPARPASTDADSGSKAIAYVFAGPRRAVERDVVGDFGDVERLVADHSEQDPPLHRASCSITSTTRSRRTASAPADDGSCR